MAMQTEILGNAYNFLNAITKIRLKSCIVISVFVISIPVVVQAQTFEEALISTYESNPQILAERARLREIDETYVQARAQGRLSADISADTGFLQTETTQASFFGNASKTSSELKPHSAQIQFIQPLYQGGRVSALKQEAKAGILSARQSLRDAEQNIFLAAATAYADIIRDEEVARLRRRNVRVLDKQAVASLERYRLGDGTKTDIAQSQSRIAGAEIGLAQADAQLASSRALFIEAIGYPPSELATIPTYILPKTLEEATRLARQNNPQLIAAMFNEEAGEAAIDVAKSTYRPTISLNGSYQLSEGQSTNLSESENTSIVAQLRIPLITGGLKGSEIRSAKHARTRLSFETRTAERGIDRQVAQLWGQLDATRRSLAASQTQVEAAKEALKGVELEKTVGTRTTLDVLDAEEEFLNSQLTVVQTQRDLDVIKFQFLTLMGAFDAQSLRLPIDYYDPVKNFRSVKFKGQDAFVDKFVPEAAQKIGKQLPNIPKDIIGVVSDSGIPIALKEDIEALSVPPALVGSVIKEAVDLITFQEADYEAERNSKSHHKEEMTIKW